MTADKVKWALAMLIVVIGVGGYYYFGGTAEPVRLTGALVALIVSVMLVATTATGRAVWEFAKGSRMELRKVVWPTGKETVQVTAIVSLIVVLVAAFLWLVDWAVFKVVKVITG